MGEPTVAGVPLGAAPSSSAWSRQSTSAPRTGEVVVASRARRWYVRRLLRIIMPFDPKG